MSEMHEEMEEVREERDVAWEELKRVWHFLEQLEQGLMDLRKSLPEGDPQRMKLLTLQLMAGMGLVRKRQAGIWLEAQLSKVFGDDKDLAPEGLPPSEEQQASR